MQTIIEYVRQRTELIVAIGALIVAAISVYHQIKAALREFYRNELRSEAIRQYADIERNPLSFNHSLVNRLDVSRQELESTSGTVLLAAQALRERAGDIVQKAGYKNSVELENFASHLYLQLEPLMAGQRKPYP